MKSYKELVQEILNQRAIIDNRDIVELSDASESVLIAFNQACEFMRDLHNWKWNTKEDLYTNDPGQNSYPMPYGIVESISFESGTGEKKSVCPLTFMSELDATKGCPSQWTNDWEKEEIKIAPAVSADCDEMSITRIKYNDRNIAVLGNRVTGTPLKRFSLEEDTLNQFLNVPEYIYDAYARCVILKTRVYLNENAQATVFPAQKQEWNEAYNGLLSYAKTPFYTSERTEI